MQYLIYQKAVRKIFGCEG